MVLGLGVTGLTSYLTFITGLGKIIIGNQLLFYGIIIAEFILIIALVGAIRKLSGIAVSLMFLFYSFLTGLTLTVIFYAFTSSSIATAFFVTAATFGAAAFYGYTTKKDLSGIGGIAFMALIGIIIGMVVNFFLNNPVIDWIVTIGTVIVFTIFTAYDNQKIKKLNKLGNEGTDEDKKEAVMGALNLYLDFINLFLAFLRLFGGRK